MQAYSLKAMRPTNEKFQSSVFYEGPKVWRNLPLEIKNSENHLIFKKKLKSKMILNEIILSMVDVVLLST